AAACPLLTSSRGSKPHDTRLDLLADGPEVPVCAGLSLARLLSHRQARKSHKDCHHDDADKNRTHRSPPFSSSSASRDLTVPMMTHHSDRPEHELVGRLRWADPLQQGERVGRETASSL